jgi:hypothetical protein
MSRDHYQTWVDEDVVDQLMEITDAESESKAIRQYLESQLLEGYDSDITEDTDTDITGNMKGYIDQQIQELRSDLVSEIESVREEVYEFHSADNEGTDERETVMDGGEEEDIPDEYENSEWFQ